MSEESLLVEFGTGLAFRFENLPVAIARPLQDLLGAFIVEHLTETPLVIRGSVMNPEGAIAADATARLIAERDGVSAYQHGACVSFESPGLRAWCNTETEEAGIGVTDAEDDVAHQFASLALLSIVFELALTRGWFGMHAAAVALNGKGVLLPGDSGRGKSTIYKNAAAAGFDTLSDDLVWLRETPNGIEIRPLPRGSLDAAAPDPSIDKATMAAIVCPAIVDANDNLLESIPLPQLLKTLVDQSGFLSPGQTSQRFTMLTRIARSAPTYRLAAGRDQHAVPALLRSLLGAV